MVPATDKFLRKISARREVTESQRAVLESLSRDVRSHPRDRTLVETGERPEESLLLLDGYACRSKNMFDGRRQILEINVPGDFIDLHSYVLTRLDHNIETLSECRILHVPHSSIRSAIADDPGLAETLWHQTMIDAAIHREWVCSLGVRPAAERMAALFCELTVRLALVGEIQGFRYPLPLSQKTLSEITGMTHVHANRIFGVLNRAKLMQFHHEEVVIDDWNALRQFAEFSYIYLDLPEDFTLPFE